MCVCVCVCIHIYVFVLPNLLKVQPSQLVPSKYLSMHLSNPIRIPAKYSYQPHFTPEKFECKNLRFKE